jgi:hypothetical protein
MKKHQSSSIVTTKHINPQIELKHRETKKQDIINYINGTDKILKRSVISQPYVLKTKFYSQMNKIFINGLQSHMNALNQLDIRNPDFYKYLNDIKKSMFDLNKTIQIEIHKFITKQHSELIYNLSSTINTSSLDVNEGYFIIDRHLDIIEDWVFEIVRSELTTKKVYMVFPKRWEIDMKKLDELYRYWKSKKGSTRVLEKSKV